MQKSFILVLSILSATLVLGSTVRAADDDRLKAIEARLASVEKENAQLKAQQTAIRPSDTMSRAAERTTSKYTANCCPVLCTDKLVDICGHHLYFTGEFLYWKPQQADVSFANTGPRAVAGAVGLNNGTSERFAEADWSPGFRIGLGYYLPYDGWDIQADYTRINFEGSKSLFDPDTTNASFAIHPNFGDNFTIGSGSIPAAVQRARAKNDIDYSNLDFTLGNRLKLKDTFSVRLFGGPRFTWLDQDFSAHYTGGDFGASLLGAHAKSSSEFFGYGVRAGADGELKLRHGFSFSGLVSASLLTGEFETNRRETRDFNNNNVIDANETVINTSRSIHRIVPNIQLAAGINWDKKLMCEKLNLRVSLGYEFTNYFNTVNRMHTADDFNAGRIDQIDGDLGFHGLYARVRLDF